MENIDEDIKIIEEFIRNYKEVQEKYKDDEIQAEIERSCYFEEVPAKAIENLLSRLKTAERMNDVLAEKLEEVAYEVDLDNIYSELYDCNGLDRNWTRGKEKEVEDIKKWARKKVEENV